MPKNTRKRTSNSTTFIFEQNNARKKNTIKSINHLNTDIASLQNDRTEYGKIVNELRKKRGMSTSNPNHGIDLSTVVKIKSAQKSKENCENRIKKNMEKILSLKKSLAYSKDLRGGTRRRKSNKTKSKK